MGQPRVNTNPVANQYTGPDERIIEFSHPSGGGLISLRAGTRDRLQVSVYRCDPGVDVIVGRPDTDDLQWDAHRTAVALAEEGIRRLLLHTDPASEEHVDLGIIQATLADLRRRVENNVPEEADHG